METCDVSAISIANHDFRQVDIDLCDFCGKCAEQCYSEALRLVGRTITDGEVLSEVLKDQQFYRQSGGGVTFSGGEPLCQPLFLKACLEACRRNNIHTAIETTGFASWDTIENILHLVDLFLYDLKTVETETHRKLTGVSNERILDNLKKLAACHQVVIRMPMVPKINDRGKAWQATMAFLKNLPWRGRIDLLPYHTLGLGKYAALNRTFALDTSLRPDMDIVHRCQKQLVQAGFSARVNGG